MPRFLLMSLVLLLRHLVLLPRLMLLSPLLHLRHLVLLPRLLLLSPLLALWHLVLLGLAYQKERNLILLGNMQLLGPLLQCPAPRRLLPRCSHLSRSEGAARPSRAATASSTSLLTIVHLWVHKPTEPA